MTFDAALIKYNVLPCDFDALQELVGKNYLSDISKELLKTSFNNYPKSLIVEEDYVDSDFRSLYYYDLAKRFKHYDKNIIRVHFIALPPELIDITQLSNENYLGYLTLRFGHENSIATTYIVPKVINRIGGYCLKAKFKAHLQGKTFDILTYPWMQQDEDIVRCAHVVLWSVIRYIANKNRGYSNATLGELIELIQSDRRKIPSGGLTMDQIVKVLKANKFSVETFYRNDGDEDDLPTTMYRFIESGIPILAICAKYYHAITIVGHGAINEAREYVEKNNRTGIVDSFELCPKLIVTDDNKAPFSYLPLEYSSPSCPEKPQINSLKDIDAIVVPLSQRMYLHPPVLQSGVLQSLEEDDLNRLTGKTLIRRAFLTSSKKFRKIAALSGCFDTTHKNLILSLHFPKFIWIAEYSSPENFDNQLVDYRFIIDSTSRASEMDQVLFRQVPGTVFAKTFGLGKTYQREVRIEEQPTTSITGNLAYVT